MIMRTMAGILEIGAGLILGLIGTSFLFFILFLKRDQFVEIPGGVPPGSFGWPIIGDTLEFVKLKSRDGAASYFKKKRDKFGGIFKTHLFFHPTVVISGPEAHKLLQTQDGYGSLIAAKLFSLKDLFGAKSLFVVDSEEHRRIRKTITATMNSKVLRNQIPRLEELATQTLQSWEGTQVSALEELEKFTFYSIIGLLLSLKPSEYTETRLRPNFQILAQNGACLPIKVPGSAFYRASQARKRLVDELRKVLEGRRKNGKVYEDVLYELMMQPESAEKHLQYSNLSDEEIIDNILSFVFAGYETTSSALARILELLADHPHELKLVREEQRRIKQELGGGRISWETLKCMPHTTMVINEALRVSHLGTAIVIRTAKNDIIFEGYKIPKGWNIIFDKASTDDDAEIYDEPLKFKPARFQVVWGKTMSSN